MLKGTLSQTTRVIMCNGGAHSPSHTTGQVSPDQREGT